jgi:hypothetical protein
MVKSFSEQLSGNPKRTENWQWIAFSPHSSVDRALPSGGKNPRSSRGGGT